MFRKPTTRSLCNPKPNRYFFTDLPGPINPRAGNPSSSTAEEAGGAGAESYVNGKRTGYRINAGDQADLPNGGPNSDPSSNTGASLGEQMASGPYQEQIAEFPLDGNRYVYWPKAGPNGYVVMRQEQGTAGAIPEAVGTYPQTANSYLWFDTTTLAFRLFRTYREPVDMNPPGITAGREASATAGDSMTKLKSINARNKAFYNKKG